jgi:hypothetical protein
MGDENINSADFFNRISRIKSKGVYSVNAFAKLYLNKLIFRVTKFSTTFAKKQKPNGIIRIFKDGC